VDVGVVVEVAVVGVAPVVVRVLAAMEVNEN